MHRLNPSELAELRDRIGVAAREPMRKPRRRNKYGNVPVFLDGKRFDSEGEGKRFIELSALQKAGKIFGLETQVSFELLPAQVVAGRKEKPVVYVADFVYEQGGKRVVEDVKSGPTKTREYIIKRKLMLHVHGIAVQEVMVK